MVRFRDCFVLLACAFVALSVASPSALAQGGAEIGARLGVGDDPDQIIGGVQIDLGRFYDDFRFVPSLDLGLGDDATMLLATAPVHYVIPNASAVTPYFGVGLVVGWIDYDDDFPGRGNDDSEVEIGFKALAGVEGKLRGGRRVFAELAVLSDDFHDIQLVGGISWPLR